MDFAVLHDVTADESDVRGLGDRVAQTGGFQILERQDGHLDHPAVHKGDVLFKQGVLRQRAGRVGVFLRAVGLHDGARMRMSRVDQDVPSGNAGRLFDVLAEAFAPLRRDVADVHAQKQKGILPGTKRQCIDLELIQDAVGDPFFKITGHVDAEHRGDVDACKSSFQIVHFTLLFFILRMMKTENDVFKKTSP